MKKRSDFGPEMLGGDLPHLVFPQTNNPELVDARRRFGPGWMMVAAQTDGLYNLADISENLAGSYRLSNPDLAFFGSVSGIALNATAGYIRFHRPPFEKHSRRDLRPFSTKPGEVMAAHASLPRYAGIGVDDWPYPSEELIRIATCLRAVAADSEEVRDRLEARVPSRSRSLEAHIARELKQLGARMVNLPNITDMKYMTDEQRMGWAWRTDRSAVDAVSQFLCARGRVVSAAGFANSTSGGTLLLAEQGTPLVVSATARVTLAS